MQGAWHTQACDCPEFRDMMPRLEQSYSSDTGIGESFLTRIRMGKQLHPDHLRSPPNSTSQEPMTVPASTCVLEGPCGRTSFRSGNAHGKGNEMGGSSKGKSGVAGSAGGDERDAHQKRRCTGPSGGALQACRMRGEPNTRGAGGRCGLCEHTGQKCWCKDCGGASLRERQSAGSQCNTAAARAPACTSASGAGVKTAAAGAPASASASGAGVEAAGAGASAGTSARGASVRIWRAAQLAEERV